ncbi:hypothetical protein IGI04_039970 [Brassica rapa subsp. trilocularis]|uniref:CCHC-type domain-containing protein n=1 Tax=Brassica rapa subsp. trilocularis TaxID=1813537 RepID=A0ABQ7KQ24_BRACM|nr:hypothetical protein IGI04_039970 [Brassica rapa subsp. trilocularis]
MLWGGDGESGTAIPRQLRWISFWVTREALVVDASFSIVNPEEYNHWEEMSSCCCKLRGVVQRSENGWRSRLNTEPLRKNLLVTTDGGGGQPEDFPHVSVPSHGNGSIPPAQQGPISLQETLDLEPSERDIGELSQPPTTEIRSATPPPPSHSLVRSRSFSRRSTATRPHTQEEEPRVNPTRLHLRRTFAEATAVGHRPFAAGKPHRRRVSAAAGDFPLSHHRRWPPPATGLRRLAAGVHSYHFSTLLRDVWTTDAALVGGGSEKSGLATQIVWGVDVETFAFDAALEAGVQRQTVLATQLGVLLLKSVVCVFSIPIPHGVTHLLLTPPIPFPFQMPPRKRVVRTQAASASREGGDEHVPPPVPPIDQDALRQMVQDAARVAAQEVVRQMAAAQQGQQVPPVQAQGHQQPPIQPVPPVQVQGQQQPPIQHVPGIFQVPPPAPPVLPGQVPEVVPPILPGQVPEVDETLMRTINCPLRLCLNIAELYMHGDALVWSDGVRSMRDDDMTYEDFLIAFDKKYFPREALHQKRNAFEHLRQGTRSVREYEREFCQLRLFAGNHFDGEDLIRRFLDGMRVDLRGRCSMVTYTSLVDLVEKAVVQEACIAEEQKYSKAPPKTGRNTEPQKRTWDQSNIQCYNCGKIGHLSRNCRSNPMGARAGPAAPAALTAPVAQGVQAAYAPGACFTCGQFGHISRFCPTKGPGAKRQAITPRVYALGEANGAEPIADLEPSERDIGELSQPPTTEIRSATPPPSHSLGHQCVRDVETSPEQEFQPEIRRDAPTRAGGRTARESHAPPSPPDVRRSHRSRPPSVRRREAASPPRLRRRRDVWTSDAALVGGGSETSGLATQIVWGVDVETFAFDAALEGGGTETDCTSDAAYASCLFMLELNFHSGSSITQMPPRKRVVRTQAASASREGGDEHVPPPVPPIDQDALRQMVQDAARVAAQEVVRQMAAAQQGQQVPPVQAQGHQQPPIQPVPPVQVQGQQQPPIQHVPGIFQVPPPAPPVLPGQVPEVVPPILPGQVPEVDETLMRTINCPLRLCLNIAELYMHGDALVWSDGVRSMRDDDMTYEDFLIAFDKKYFPREALHQKRNAFEHLRQGTRSVREYEREFCQLRLFAGNHFDGEDLIRRFLDGMRVDLRGRCSMVTYTSLVDLVEKAVVQEACIAEEQKYSKAPPKTGRNTEPQKRTWDQSNIQCYNCGKIGHLSRNCRSNPMGARAGPAAPAALTAPVAQGVQAAYAPGACFTCGQFGHISRFCPTKGPGAKRQAITPRVYALGEANGAEPIAGMYLYHTRMFF